MEKQNIIISTVPVTIKVVEVGGKKMTLSVFKQIPEKDFFILSETKEQRKASFLGFVSIPNMPDYFIFVRRGVLYKCKVDDDINRNLSGWETECGKKVLDFVDSQNIDTAKDAEFYWNANLGVMFSSFEIKCYRLCLRQYSFREDFKEMYIYKNQIYISI